MSWGETALHATGPQAPAPSPHHMNSSCPIQRVSIIDGPSQQVEATALFSQPLLQWPRMASGGPRPLPTVANDPTVLVPTQYRTPTTLSPLLTVTRCSVSVHFRYGQREIGLPEVRETPVVIELGFPEPLGATHGWAGSGHLPGCSGSQDTFNCSQISPKERVWRPNTNVGRLPPNATQGRTG